MSIGSEISATPPVRRRFSLPRFPARWAVETPGAERIFARLLWFLVPLQYYVVAHVPHGFSGDDLLAAVTLSLMSVAVIFVLSFAAAWLVSMARPLDPDRGDILTGRVRMWVVALMICTAAAYLPLALSLAANQLTLRHDIVVYGDLVTQGVRMLLEAAGVDDRNPALVLPTQIVSNLVYAFASVIVLTLVLRTLRPGSASPAGEQEPDAISVGLIVACLMTAANYATMD